MGLIVSILHGLASGLWAIADIGICIAAMLAFVAIRDRLAARRRRIAEERATWRDSVTKQTKPPPVASVIEGVRAKEFAVASDPDLTNYIALAVPKASPTALASAAKVRRVSKRKTSK